ncbi:tyrosine-protein phosphatase [Virgibacillus sp. JSM 102003]|uniref:tyrosine-protein phosphatase n=1 Tax=Virgibacillus sp. JSM 102003 TaxID=1562108 RepID=UPI0035C13E5F
MIDIHCHILPGLDDGAKSVTESIMMANEAAKQGITKIVATPHHNNESFMNYGTDITGAVDYLNGQLQKENIPVEILEGQETRVYGDMLEDLKNGQVIAINKESDYVFVELPTYQVPKYTTQLLFDMQIAGYKPVIVHPERNHELQDDPDKLYRIVKNGALTQITAASLLGFAGKKFQRFANQMIESNLTHFIASDAHNVKKRGFFMREASRYLKKHYGNTTEYTFMENSELMIIGQTVHQEPPERIITKKKWGVFNK